MQATLYAKLNAETGQLCWRELEAHFARGAVIKVEPGLDLIEVAASMAADDAVKLGAWLEQGVVARAGERDATAWSATPERLFWAVVVAPWVLVQPIVAGVTVHSPYRCGSGPGSRDTP